MGNLRFFIDVAYVGFIFGMFFGLGKWVITAIIRRIK